MNVNSVRRLGIVGLVFLPTLLLPLPAAGVKGIKTESTPKPIYVDQGSTFSPTPGSLWTPQGMMADLASDYKAHNVNDVIIIRIVESTISDTAGNLQSSRKFSTSTGITALGGTLKATNSLQNLLNGNSSTTLAGQADSSSSNSLNTIIGGRVIQVLPNGVLVVEANRELEMNGQKHQATVRGLVRPGDIAADNSVLSTQMSDLQAAVKGKGVISDATRAPNPVVRWFLRLLSF